MKPATRRPTVHVRRRFRRAGGSQFYRDYSNRGLGTHCGATEGEWDLSHNNARSAGGVERCAASVRELGRDPCPECFALWAASLAAATSAAGCAS